MGIGDLPIPIKKPSGSTPLSMKKKILLILSLFLVSAIGVLCLFVLSNKNYHQRQSFTRLFVRDVLYAPTTTDIKYKNYYIAGATENKIYLGNVTAPLHLLAVNKTLTDTQHLAIKTEEIKRLKATYITIDSPNFYMTDWISHAIFHGDLQHLKAKRYMYDSAFLADAVPLGPQSFAIRTFTDNSSDSTKEFVLAKETKYPPYIKRVPGLLEKQIDGLFCTDGMLHYNQDLRWYSEKMKNEITKKKVRKTDEEKRI